MSRFFLLLILVSPVSLCMAEERPNIVFVMVDDLGYGDLPCYGATDLETPNIDQLVADGVRLTAYYAAGAECTPTRTALMTGLYPQRIGGLECAIGTGNVGRYDDAIRLRKTHDLGLPSQQSILASELKKAGYTTAVFGKWHLGYEPKHHPYKSGFDHFYGFIGGYVDYYRHRELSDLDVFFDGQKPVVQPGYMTHLITEKAIEFVRKQQNSKQPFFLYVPFSAPHFPFQKPNADPGEMTTAETLTKGTRDAYVSMLVDLDKSVGRIQAELTKAGVSENTLFVFASDHGAIKPGSNSPFRGFKGGLFEGGIRTACIMKWPGKLPKNSVSDQPTITMDLTVSFLSAAGVGIDRNVDGVDMIGHLAARTKTKRQKLFWRAKRGTKVWRAVRNGDWKHVTRFENGKHDSWMFNLKNDPGETTDLSDKHPQILADLKLRLQKFETDVKPTR